jgi:hypothetical protein
MPNTDPYNFSLDELQDLSIDDQKQQNHGCGPDISGSQAGSWKDQLRDKGFGWPDNGEFNWGDMGDGCTMCAGVWDYGKECNSGVGGRRPKVKRVAFNGNKDDCCWANHRGKDSTKTKDGKTCDPKYRDPNGNDCTSVYRPFCESGSRIVDNDWCKPFESSNSTLYNTLMKNYCNSSYDSAKHSRCIDWCKSNSTQCTTLNTLTDCQKYGLKTNNCTSENVVKMQTLCKQYGLESEQGMRLYGCNADAISTFKKECSDNNVDLKACTPISLQDAKVNNLNKQSLQLQQTAVQQSQQNYNETQQMITNVINTDKINTDKNNLQVSGDNSIIIFVIIAFILFLLLSSSSFLMTLDLE